MIRYFFQDYILGQYIDWKSGECSFDGEEFVAFIKWVAEPSDGVDSEETPVEMLLGTMPEERLLDIMATVFGADFYMLNKTYFGEEVTTVGYPTAGGEVSHHGTLINQLGIVAASDKKEGAWQFIESFLSRENGRYIFMPARQDRLEEEIAKKAESKIPVYLPDGSREDFSAITEEEIEKFYAIIDEADFTSRNGIREEIINIVVEEMSLCLSSDKPYEEAAAIVQNRVKNMVQEEISSIQ